MIFPMKKKLLYVVLKEIFEKKVKDFNLDQLSELLIELDVNNHNLTPVIEGLNGLCTPHLEYRLCELVIFNILNQGSPYHLTKNGLEYINEQTKPIYENQDFKGFLELTNKLIDEILISP